MKKLYRYVLAVFILVVMLIGINGFFARNIYAVSVKTNTEILNIKGTSSTYQYIEDTYGDKAKKYDGSKEWYMYVYYETINGEWAFCLDPGLSIAKDYKKVEYDNSLAESAIKAIYNADFIHDSDNNILTLKYATTSGTKIIRLDEKDNYIIKQFFFWALQKGKLLNSTRGYVTSINSDVIRDVRAAIIKRHDDGSDSRTKTYEGLKALASMDITVYNRDDAADFYGTICDGFKNFVSNYNDGVYNTGTLTVTSYQPSSGSSDYQRFVSIYVTPETTPNKKYAVVTCADGTYSLYKNFGELNADLKYNAPTVDGKNCTGYSVYKAHALGEMSATDFPEYINSSDSGSSSSCSLSYSSAYEYNVIVFEYSSVPTYTLTIKYTLNGSELPSKTETRTGIVGGSTQSITNSLTYSGITYGSGFLSSVDGLTGINTAASTISFTMPSEDKTVTLNYKYRNINC